MGGYLKYPAPNYLLLWGGVCLSLAPAPVQNSVHHNRFMGIEEDSLLFLCGWNPLFQLVGFGVAFEVHRMPAVVHALQNTDNGAILLIVEIFGK